MYLPERTYFLECFCPEHGLQAVTYVISDVIYAPSTCPDCGQHLIISKVTGLKHYQYLCQYYLRRNGDKPWWQ